MSKIDNKEDIKVEVVKPRPSREELKRQVRRANLNYAGRLTIDEKLKTPGKRLRIDNDDGPTRQYLESLGYTVKIDPNFKVGSGSLSEPNNMGSAIHVEQGITASQPGIVYEIDEDLYQARLEVAAEDNQALLQQTVEANQYEGMDKRYN